MGRIRRGGYVFEWWIGDHTPRHVHVSDQRGNILGRIKVETGEPLDAWIPPKKVLALLKELQKENRL